MRPRVNAEKHIVQRSLFAVAAGAINNFSICNTVAVPTGPTQIREGAIISAVYVEMWITSDDAAAGTAVVTLEKISSAGTVMSTTNAGALNDYLNKKQVLHVQMGLTGSNVQYPMATIRGWFKIPKGKQRFSLGDTLNMNIFAQSNGVAACGFMIYKEQF